MLKAGDPVIFQTIAGRNRPPQVRTFIGTLEDPEGTLAAVQDADGVEWKTWAHLVQFRESHRTAADAGASVVGPVVLVRGSKGLSWLAVEDGEGGLQRLPLALPPDPLETASAPANDDADRKPTWAEPKDPARHPFVRVRFLPLRHEEATMIRSALRVYASGRGQRPGPKVQALMDKLEKFASFRRPYVDEEG